MINKIKQIFEIINNFCDMILEVVCDFGNTILELIFIVFFPITVFIILFLFGFLLYQINQCRHEPMQIIIQDDLSGLTEFKVLVQGFREIDGEWVLEQESDSWTSKP